MIRGVVFDFDGTLVNSNDIKLQAFYDVTKSYDPTGSTVSRVLKQYPNKDRYGIFQNIAREILTKDLKKDDENFKGLATQWAEDYTFKCEKAIENCEEVPGTSEALRWITEQHLPIFINSRTPTTTLKRLVSLRSLHSYVAEIYGAPATKSENLRDIQNQIRAQPKEILFVGDSDDDREAANEVGCYFAGVILRNKSRFSSPSPKVCISDLSQLQTILGTLQMKQPPEKTTH